MAIILSIFRFISYFTSGQKTSFERTTHTSTARNVWKPWFVCVPCVRACAHELICWEDRSSFLRFFFLFCAFFFGSIQVDAMCDDVASIWLLAWLNERRLERNQMPSVSHRYAILTYKRKWMLRLCAILCSQFSHWMLLNCYSLLFFATVGNTHGRFCIALVVGCEFIENENTWVGRQRHGNLIRFNKQSMCLHSTWLTSYKSCTNETILSKNRQ